MENTSRAFTGTTGTAGSRDRVRFEAIMAKASFDSGHRQTQNAGEDASAGDLSAEPRRDAGPSQQPGLERPAYTLRVKPDRRRVQLPIAADHDRRRSR